MADKYIYYVAPMFNRQPLVYPRPAASASADISCVWQCVAHDLHHHFVRLRFSRRMPLFNVHSWVVLNHRGRGWSRTKGGVTLIMSAATTLAGVGLERPPPRSGSGHTQENMGGKKTATGFEPGTTCSSGKNHTNRPDGFCTTRGAKIAYMNN